MPCRVAGCIISIEAYVCACTYLLTYLAYLRNWLWAYKTGNISETVEYGAKVTINGLRAYGLYKVVHRFSIAAKM